MAHPIAPQQQAQGQARSNNVAPHKLIPRVHELPASISDAQPRQFLYRTESRASRFSPYRSFPSSVIGRLVNEAIQYDTCSNKKKVGWSGDRERESVCFSTTRSIRLCAVTGIGLHRVSHVTQVYAPRRVCAFASVNWCESGRRNDDTRRSSCPMPLIDFTGRKRASALRLIGN